MNNFFFHSYRLGVEEVAQVGEEERSLLDVEDGAVGVGRVELYHKTSTFSKIPLAFYAQLVSEA